MPGAGQRSPFCWEDENKRRYCPPAHHWHRNSGTNKGSQALPECHVGLAHRLQMALSCRAGPDPGDYQASTAGNDGLDSVPGCQYSGSLLSQVIGSTRESYELRMLERGGASITSLCFHRGHGGASEKLAQASC